MTFRRKAKGTWLRTGWGAFVLGVAGICALSQFEGLPLAKRIQSFDDSAFWLLVFGPAISWEAFCRLSPRPTAKLALIGSSLLCIGIYMWAVILAFIALGSLMGIGPLRWSHGSLDSTITPEMRAMYGERAIAFAASVILASGVVVASDFWRARRIAAGGKAPNDP